MKAAIAEAKFGQYVAQAIQRKDWRCQESFMFPKARQMTADAFSGTALAHQDIG